MKCVVPMMTRTTRLYQNHDVASNWQCERTLDCSVGELVYSKNGTDYWGDDSKNVTSHLSTLVFYVGIKPTTTLALINWPHRSAYSVDTQSQWGQYNVADSWPDLIQTVRPGVQMSAQHGSWIPGRDLPTCLQHRQTASSTTCSPWPSWRSTS